MAKIYYKGRDYSRAIGGSGGGGGSVDSTDIPTAGKVSEFDSNAHINSEDMSAQDINNFVNNIEGQGVNLADYIVEQGTSGMWTYRKWNSGIAECWGTETSRSYAMTNNYGSGSYYASGSVTLPSGLFISAPSVTATRCGGTQGTGLITVSVYGIGTTTISLYAISNGTSNTLNISFAFDCKGRWK